VKVKVRVKGMANTMIRRGVGVGVGVGSGIFCMSVGIQRGGGAVCGSMKGVCG
jgi:hypothetical protein